MPHQFKLPIDADIQCFVFCYQPLLGYLVLLSNPSGR